MSEPHISLEDLRVEWANAAHSIFGPSSSAMYLICLGSLIPHLLAEDESSFEAAEGTVGHFVGDKWLRNDKRPDDEIGNIHVVEGHAIEVTEMMLGYVEKYVDWCQNIVGYDHYYETRTDISHLTPIPGQAGTADHYALKFGHMVITDLKYGEGVKVWAAEDKDDPRGVIIDMDPDGTIKDINRYELNGNTQAMLYALGVFMEWDWFYNFQKITIRICQPRLDHYDVWETTREDLLVFAKWASARMKLAWTHGAPRTPSEKGCRWCRIRKTCPAHTAWLDDRIGSRFKDLDEPSEPRDTYSVQEMHEAVETISDPTALAFDPVNPAEMTIEQISNILRYRKMIEQWFESMAQHLLKTLEGDEGIEVPHWKVVQGQARRKFREEQEADEWMDLLGIPEDQRWTRKLASPNQAEDWLRATHNITKKQAASLLADYVTQPQGPRTLARINDARSELEPDGDRFRNLDTDL